jgi:hypothetical protein
MDGLRETSLPQILAILRRPLGKVDKTVLQLMALIVWRTEKHSQYTTTVVRLERRFRLSNTKFTTNLARLSWVSLFVPISSSNMDVSIFAILDAMYCVQQLRIPRFRP